MWCICLHIFQTDLPRLYMKTSFLCFTLVHSGGFTQTLFWDGGNSTDIVNVAYVAYITLHTGVSMSLTGFLCTIVNQWPACSSLSGVCRFSNLKAPSKKLIKREIFRKLFQLHHKTTFYGKHTWNSFNRGIVPGQSFFHFHIVYLFYFSSTDSSLFHGSATPSLLLILFITL